MTRPPFEVADIIRQHGDRFIETHGAWLTGHHRRVLRALARCRTAALGGHLVGVVHPGKLGCARITLEQSMPDLPRRDESASREAPMVAADEATMAAASTGVPDRADAAARA